MAVTQFCGLGAPSPLMQTPLLSILAGATCCPPPASSHATPLLGAPSHLPPGVFLSGAESQ